MMPDHDELKAHHEQLVSTLLPEDPPSTETLSAENEFLTRAYLVLAHGLVEEFVELCFTDFVNSGDKTWEATANRFIPLGIAFADDIIGQKHKPTPPSVTREIAAGLYASKIVYPNNGIKRKNLLALARPLALEDSLNEECNDLLMAGERLGAERGSVAHQFAVSKNHVPSDVHSLVTDFIDQLPNLQALLDN